MRLLSSLLLISVLAVPLAARAQSPVVVELYTSQGCSSCPPADVLLGELKERNDIIALSLHVDYWDYLGWKDIFASPQFTERQRKYTRVRGGRSVYTPQMVIQGVGQGVGSRRKVIAELISAGLQQVSDVAVEASRSGKSIEIRLRAGTGTAVQMVVQLVEYTPVEKVEIKRGENAGKTLEYHNVVRRWDVVGKWDGKADVTLQAQSESDLPVAIIVQAEGNGPILAAFALE